MEDIPPPRPPPNFGPRKKLELSSTSGDKTNSVELISNLPPLPKPTPVNQAPSLLGDLPMASPLNTEASAYRISGFASSRSEYGIDAFHRGAGQPPTQKERAGTYKPGLPRIVEEYTKSEQNDQQGSFPRGYKKPELEHHTPLKHRQGTGATEDVGDISTRGKRKKQDNRGEKGQRKKQRGVPAQDEHPRAREEEFGQIEDFIINAIYDDAFVELVERIGGIWQRMGFDDVGQNFFGGIVSDGRI